MAETQHVIDTLKGVMRERHLTYAKVAEGLEMSEANVKRLFASKRITLERIEAICRLMEMELSDLFQIYEESRARISQLTIEQEKELIADSKLLFAAVCVRNHLEFDDILQHYNISESELIQSLARLDRLKIIDFLPHNRIKLRVAENFRWIPNGPIEKFYEKAIENEFLKGGFDGKENLRLFMSGLLSERSQAVIHQRLQVLSSEITQLHRQDSKLPMEKRRNIGILIAMREWQFTALQSYAKSGQR